MVEPLNTVDLVVKERMLRFFDGYPSRFHVLFDIFFKSSSYKWERNADGKFELINQYPYDTPVPERISLVEERYPGIVMDSHSLAMRVEMRNAMLNWYSDNIDLVVRAHSSNVPGMHLKPPRFHEPASKYCALLEIPNIHEIEPVWVDAISECVNDVLYNIRETTCCIGNKDELLSFLSKSRPDLLPNANLCFHASELCAQTMEHIERKEAGLKLIEQVMKEFRDEGVISSEENIMMEMEKSVRMDFN